jgi:hypothetical protein
MRQGRTERARQPAAGYDELNEIVAQVFAALDGGDLADDEAPIEGRNVFQRRTGAPSEGRDSKEAAEAVSFDPEESAEQSSSDRPGVPADAEMRAEGLRSSAGSLAIATDEEDFVRQAAAWLASRSNAEGVLDRVRVAILEHTASVEAPARATAGDASGGSERGG